MIDFSLHRSEGRYGRREEYLQMLKLRTDDIFKDLSDLKNNKFVLGCHLIDLYKSKFYSAWATSKKMDAFRKVYHWSCCVGNCSSEVFFAYCNETFGLNKSQVSRYMNIVAEFGDALIGFKEEWQKYSYSQLVEMLPLSEDQRKVITPDMSVQSIREYKKSLVATSQQEEKAEKNEVATSQQEDVPVTCTFDTAAIFIPYGRSEYAPYECFRGMTAKYICDKYLELEKKFNALEQEYSEYKQSLDIVDQIDADHSESCSELYRQAIFD